MFDQMGFNVTEVKMILRGGSDIMLRLPGDFEEWPNGPFTLGNKGGTVLYVTYSSPSGSNERGEYKGMADKYWGVLVTYIPADQIVGAEIRHVCTTDDE